MNEKSPKNSANRESFDSSDSCDSRDSSNSSANRESRESFDSSANRESFDSRNSCANRAKNAKLANRNAKKGTRGIRRIFNAFLFSLNGFRAAFKDEEAFRQIIFISAILIPLGAFLGESFSQKVILALPCVLCIIAELANSAIENAIDFTSLELHPLAKKAKDMGSAIQLTALIFLICVWGGYLAMRFL